MNMNRQTDSLSCRSELASEAQGLGTTEPPLVMGGQGHAPEAVISDAMAWFLAMGLAAFVLAVAALAIWVWG